MELILGAISSVLSFILGVVFRPYLTGYATKKGENLATHEDKRIVAASDFLVYSLACAELMWFTNEESIELIHNLKTVMSANMRTLLS